MTGSDSSSSDEALAAALEGLTEAEWVELVAALEAGWAPADSTGGAS